MLGVICSLYAVVLLVSQLASHGSHGSLVVAPTSTLWNALPAITVAYSPHYNGERHSLSSVWYCFSGIVRLVSAGPRFFQELENRTIHRYVIAVALAVALTATLYIVVAVIGYVTFGNGIKGNFLNNFDGERLSLALGLFSYSDAFSLCSEPRASSGWALDARFQHHHDFPAGILIGMLNGVSLFQH